MIRSLGKAIMGTVLLFGCSSSLQAQMEVPQSSEEGGPRVFEVTASSLNLRERTSTNSAVVTRVERGTILRNLGCSQETDRVWCDVQPLTGGARGFAAADFLTPSVSPDGSIATGPDNSALRAGQGDFDATSVLPCSRTSMGAMEECAIGVARAGGGFATVVFTHEDGATRAIFFANGIAVGADTSAEGNSGPFTASKSADVHYINVGNERYEVIDAAILGG